jgi:hypothetical protein
MSAPLRLTHEEREKLVIDDLCASFPNFTGQALSWVKVPQGLDPPDFVSRDSRRVVGLELVEWLDGSQMGPAKARESQREQIHHVLTLDWENGYKPQHFRGAFPSPRRNERIKRDDEQPLRREFFACAADIDTTWSTDVDGWNNSRYQAEFPGYPLLEKYLSAIRYIGGRPHGLCWIGEQGDGGAFDPNAVVETLKNALENKVSYYSTPDKQVHFTQHALTELNLLVHGGFNTFAYNTPSGHLSLEEIARRGAHFYSTLAGRHTFNRVWFFDSLDSADHVNELSGFAPGEGRVRLLAQLWPEFTIYPHSVSG